VSGRCKKQTMTIEEAVKKEIEFCESIDCEKNEHGQFIYDSRNKKSAINLPYILMEYKDWLIENRIVSEG